MLLLIVIVWCVAPTLGVRGDVALSVDSFARTRLNAEEKMAAFEKLLVFNPTTPIVPPEAPKGTRSKVYTYRWDPCLRFACLSVHDDARCSDANQSQLTFDSERVVHGGPVPITSDRRPPCCRHLLRDILTRFLDFLRDTDVPAFIHYGTLLGAMRGDGIIAWTADVDIGLQRVAWERFMANRTQRLKLYHHGIIAFSEDRMGRVCLGGEFANGALRQWPTRGHYDNNMYYNHFPYLDVYTIPPDNKCGKRCTRDTTITEKGPCKFPRHYIYPYAWTSTCGNRSTDLSPPVTSIYSEALGECLPTPSDPVAVLDLIYGPDWHVRANGGPIHGSGLQKCKK